jgi:hypothetical protein
VITGSGLFAWSAPLGCDLLDVLATAQANPNLGLRISGRT